jgi:hypothetical protein
MNNYWSFIIYWQTHSKHFNRHFGIWKLQFILTTKQLILWFDRKQIGDSSRAAMVIWFGTYYQSPVFESRRHQTSNDLGQVTNVCLSRITRTMHTDYVWHTPTLVVSQCVRELKWSSLWTLRQAGLLSRVTASNSCKKNIGLSKLSPDSTLYRKAEYAFYFISNLVYISLL